MPRRVKAANGTGIPRAPCSAPPLPPVSRSFSFLLAFAVAISVVAAWAGTGHAQFTLYDDFAGPSIDPAKWRGVSAEGSSSAPTAEAVRVVENGSLHLGLVSWGSDTSNAGSVRSRLGLNMRQLGTPLGSGSITGLRAHATVLAAEAEDCPANPETLAPSQASTQLIGTFFNDGTGPVPPGSNRTGNILALFDLQKASDGAASIVASVRRCDDPGCESFPPIATAGNPAVFTTTWTPNTPVVLKIVWKKGGGLFKFIVNGVESASIVYLPLSDAAAPVDDFKGVRLLHDVERCLGDRKSTRMEVLFDDIS